MRASPWVLLVIFGVASIVAGVMFFPNYAKLKKLRDENERLTFENRQLEREIGDLEQKIKRVKNDPYLYERIARDSLGAAKEGEIIIDIGE